MESVNTKKERIEFKRRQLTAYNLLSLHVTSSAIYFWIQRGTARNSPAFRDDRLDSLEHCLRTIRIQWLKAI